MISRLSPLRLLPVLIVTAVVLVHDFRTAASNENYWTKPNPADQNYNLLVRGLRKGQLSLELPVPAGFAALADPYDPAANAAFRNPPVWLHDTSYFRGRLYLYFGITPALVLFWPWVALTGHFLSHQAAAALFCSAGFLGYLGILLLAWRRYFPEIPGWVVALGAAALGFATGTPILLQRAEFWEVAVVCAYAFVSIALLFFWGALHSPKHRVLFLAAASVAFGLAVGARPSVLFAAAILFVPAVLAWRKKEPGAGGLLAAAAGPLLLCGLGLMVYNELRFGSPFEFGEKYQLAADRQDTVRHFSAGNFFYNLRIYFFQPPQWSRFFPFVRDMKVPPVTAGHIQVDYCFGAWVDLPVLLFAFVCPLAWAKRSADDARRLRTFAAAAGTVFFCAAIPILLFFTCSYRYEVDYLPTLALLAVFGLLGLEAHYRHRSFARGVLRAVWIATLAYSVAFSVLDGLDLHAHEADKLGARMMAAGQVQEAIAQFNHVLQLEPDMASAQNDLGTAYLQSGRTQEAQEAYRKALSFDPNSAVTYFNLGNTAVLLGNPGEAVPLYQGALQHGPDNAQAHNGLGYALAELGRGDDAVAQFRRALQLRPDFAEAHLNLANLLAQAGYLKESLPHYEAAAQSNPGWAEVHYAWAGVLKKLGQFDLAAAQYREAFRLKPDLKKVAPIDPDHLR